MERLVQDTRFAARVLWKDRGFAVTAILTLALCIGANAAIFAVVNSVLLRPLPVPEPEQLVHMYNAYPGAGPAAAGSTGVPDYFDRLRETDVFQEQALYRPGGVTVGSGSGSGSDPQRVMAMFGTPSLLRILQVPPLRGRLFADEDGEIGKTRKVVLTYDGWQQWFGGHDSALGQALRVNGEPHTILGVLPRGFRFLDPDVKLWLPVAFSDREKSDDSRHSNNWQYLGRLKAGRSVEQARQQIDALNARNLDRFPALKEILINARFHTVVVPLQAQLVQEIRSTLVLLWGGVVFVLLVCFLRRGLRPNTALTRGGAAMKSTIRDWTTRTMSMGVPVWICIWTAPARKAPNRMPAANVPHGVERPSSATVMASKPYVAATPSVRTFSPRPPDGCWARRGSKARTG